MKNRILIVEDEAITALDLRFSLEELGYEVIDTVGTGQDAIDMAAETVPDVVLMDIKLKGDMEGIDAAKVISELRIPVVYLTANTDDYTFERSNIEGSYGFVPKPYEITKLVHGEEEAKKAQSAAESLFGAGGNMDNVPTVKIENEQVGSLLLDILVAGKIIPSKAEGKRLVQQGGLSLNGEKVTDIKRTLNKEDFEDGVALIKRGKKNFNKIIIE